MMQHLSARSIACAIMLALLMQLVCPIYSLAEEAGLEIIMETDTETNESEEESAEAENVENFDAVEDDIFEETMIEINAMVYPGMLQVGDSGDAVREIQRRLTELGYFSGSIGGNYGNQTADAVKAFQIRIGTEATGVFDEYTFVMLFDEFAPVAEKINIGNNDDEEESTPIPEEYIPEFTGVIKKGSTGSAVKMAQQRLIELAYLEGTADGSFGSKTEEAIKAFQIAIGTVVDGTLNFETHIRLYSQSAPYKGTIATEMPINIITPAPTATEPVVTLPPIITEEPTATPSATSVPAFPGEMKNGSYGNNVRTIQQRLQDLGYLYDKVDGAYGNNTAGAVMAFQAKSGLEQTGRVDEKTYYLLMSSFAVRADEATPAPTATPDPDEDEYEIPDYPGMLQYGMSGDAVKQLQQRLMELGYYNGSVYGNFGELTRNAVKLFQSAVDLTADGVVGKKTHEALYAKNAPLYNDNPEYGDLMSGDSGSEVGNLQAKLKALGYYVEDVNNYFDANTIASVMAFQTMNGLQCNGVACSETQTRLYSSEAINIDGQVGDIRPTAAPTQYATLSYGSTGSAVTALQNRLIELGYFDGIAGTTYGNKTETSVKAFQAKAGLPQSGVADNETQQLLYSENAPGKDDAVVTPAPSATPAPTYSVLKSGSTGAEVTNLQTRMKELGYDVEINGSYDDKTLAAVKLFQRASGLSVDGAAGTATQTRIYATDALTATEAEEIIGSGTDEETNTPVKVSGTAPKPQINNIVSMDWFENNGEGEFFARSGGSFSVGDTAIVTDVSTGISYRVRRYGGSNHADVEPLTMFDAYQMFRIYNFTWSWARRAVVVTVAGKNIAASINGYPHGSGAIDTNNFIGHSCIHFTNSRTHGTNRVDPDHQAAIKTALGASVSSLNSKIQAQ